MARRGHHGSRRSFPLWSSFPPRPRVRARHSLSKHAAILALVASFFVAQACYHYRLTPPDPSPETEWRGKTAHSLFWGLVQEDLEADNCLDDVIDQVRVTTNAGFALLTIVTLGFWAPVRVEWRCASTEAPPGQIPEQAGDGE